MSFNTYFAAHNKLQTWLDDYNLCLRYCGLTEEDSLCFNHQIKKCNGICAEEEEVVAISKKSQVIRVDIKEIPELGRQTQGVRIMKLRDGDGIASLICL